MLILFLVDTSASMNQASSFGFSLIDVAKCAVEKFIQARGREPSARYDRYFLVTCEEGAANVKVEWKNKYADFNEALKNLKANDLTQLGSSVKSSFNLLNQYRMQRNYDSYGQGLCPWTTEPAAVIVLTDIDFRKECNYADLFIPMDNNNSHIIPSGQESTSTQLTIDPFRWDQRLFIMQFHIPAVMSSLISPPLRTSFHDSNNNNTSNGDPTSPPAFLRFDHHPHSLDYNQLKVEVLSRRSHETTILPKKEAKNLKKQSKWYGDIWNIDEDTKSAKSKVSDGSHIGVFELCQLSGGKNYIINGMGQLNSSIDSLVKTLRVTGVTVHFSPSISFSVLRSQQVGSDGVISGKSTYPHTSTNIKNNDSLAENQNASSPFFNPTSSSKSTVKTEKNEVNSQLPPPSVKSVSLVIPPPQKSFEGHWPVPEDFIFTTQMTSLPQRRAQPHITYLDMPEPFVGVEYFPLDTYLVTSSPLTNYIIQHNPMGRRNLVHPIFIGNSNIGGTQQPFGFLKASRNGIVCCLLPYNYPVLFPLLREYNECAQSSAPPTSVWKMQFETYLRDIPPYYIPYLKRAFSQWGSAQQISVNHLITDAYDHGMNYQLVQYLADLKKNAQREIELNEAERERIGHLNESEKKKVLNEETPLVKKSSLTTEDLVKDLARNGNYNLYEEPYSDYPEEGESIPTLSQAFSLATHNATEKKNPAPSTSSLPKNVVPRPPTSINFQRSHNNSAMRTGPGVNSHYPPPHPTAPTNPTTPTHGKVSERVPLVGEPLPSMGDVELAQDDVDDITNPSSPRSISDLPTNVFNIDRGQLLYEIQRLKLAIFKPRGENYILEASTHSSADHPSDSEMDNVYASDAEDEPRGRQKERGSSSSSMSSATGGSYSRMVSSLRSPAMSVSPSTSPSRSRSRSQSRYRAAPSPDPRFNMKVSEMGNYQAFLARKQTLRPVFEDTHTHEQAHIFGSPYRLKKISKFMKEMGRADEISVEEGAVPVAVTDKKHMRGGRTGTLHRTPSVLGNNTSNKATSSNSPSSSSSSVHSSSSNITAVDSPVSTIPNASEKHDISSPADSTLISSSSVESSTASKLSSFSLNVSSLLSTNNIDMSTRKRKRRQSSTGSVSSSCEVQSRGKSVLCEDRTAVVWEQHLIRKRKASLSANEYYMSLIAELNGEGNRRRKSIHTNTHHNLYHSGKRKRTKSSSQNTLLVGRERAINIVNRVKEKAKHWDMLNKGNNVMIERINQLLCFKTTFSRDASNRKVSDSNL